MPGFKIVATFAVLSAATLADASPYSGTDRFTDAKTGFRVNIRTDGSTMRLTGRQPVTHQTFNLAITGDKVTGVWLGEPVNYTIRSDAHGSVSLMTDAGLVPR